MNDEIKEILRNCEKAINEASGYNDTTDKLLDYITNLQQENERLKEENNNKAMNDYAHAIDESWYRELYDDYKSRCEKAIDMLKELNECIKDMLDIGIDIKNISDIEDVLQKKKNILVDNSK